MNVPSLSVVLLQEGERWVAVSLEVFFAAQSQTMAGALRELLQLIQRSALLDAQFQNQPFALDEKAPDYYWDKFRGAELQVNFANSTPPTPTLGDLRVAA